MIIPTKVVIIEHLLNKNQRTESNAELNGQMRQREKLGRNFELVEITASFHSS